MTIVLFVVAMLALGFTLYPLFKTRTQAFAAVSDEDEKLRDLQARRDAAQEALRDLEVEWKSGRLTEQEYHEQERKHQERVGLIQAGTEGLDQGGVRAGVDDEIERRVAQLRQGRGAPRQPQVASDDEIEKRVSLLRQERKAAPVSNCPRCGAVLKAGHRFCAKCGLNVANLKPVLVCPNCKKEYRKGDRFCAQCGSSLPS